MILKKMTIGLALALGLGMGVAKADIQISDTYIDFKGDNDFSVTLVNTGHSIDSYKVELVKWEQKSGYIKPDGSIHQVENIYTVSENEGLAVFPTSMVLRQGQNNTLRMRVVSPAAKEQNEFKLVLREVDKKFPGNRDSGSGGQIMLKFNHRIPVFLNENEKSVKELKFERKLVTKNGKNYLHLKNLDKQPLFINDLFQGEKILPSVGYLFTGVETFVDLTNVDLKKPLTIKDRYASLSIDLVEPKK